MLLRGGAQKIFGVDCTGKMVMQVGAFRHPVEECVKLGRTLAELREAALHTRGGRWRLRRLRGGERCQNGEGDRRDRDRVSEHLSIIAKVMECPMACSTEATSVRKSAGTAGKSAFAT